MRRKLNIYAKAGQRYRVNRQGKPYRTVKVVRVHASNVRTPSATMQETTRGGRPKGESYRTTLTCNADATWRLAPGYIEMEGTNA